MTELRKFPRTPHVFGEVSGKTEDDKFLSKEESLKQIGFDEVIFTEKVDGSNVGISIVDGEVKLQSRGSWIGGGDHPQYNVLKQWASVKKPELETLLEPGDVLYGEWVYARHTVKYTQLPHYFLAFDIWNKSMGGFLSRDFMVGLLDGTGIVPVGEIYRGKVSSVDDVLEFIGKPSMYGAERIEGVYLRVDESDSGLLRARFKFVDPKFRATVDESEHWSKKPIEVQGLADKVDIYK